MSEIEYFKSTKQTHRYNTNQKVWIIHNFANHLYVYFRWRGKGAWVTGIQDKFSKCVGEIKTIDVDDTFANRVHNKLHNF